MMLVHCVSTNGQWEEIEIGGGPRPTAGTLAALRNRVCDRSSTSGDPVLWWHCDGNAWVAVTDLHRASRHDDAMQLARFLRWCDDQATARILGYWEIRS